MNIERYGRYWAVFDVDGLVCVCVYLKGAKEVLKRLTSKGDAINDDSSKEK